MELDVWEKSNLISKQKGQTKCRELLHRITSDWKISVEVCSCSCCDCKYFYEMLMLVCRKCYSFGWREDEMLVKWPHRSLGLIFLPFCVHSWKKAEFLCCGLEGRKLRTVPRSPDTKAPRPPQLINRCVLVPSQAQPLKWQSRGPIIVKNWKLNIGFISSVIKGPWNWFNAAALLLGGFLQREHKTMSSSHLLINPPNPAKLISHHNFARN